MNSARQKKARVILALAGVVAALAALVFAAPVPLGALLCERDPNQKLSCDAKLIERELERSGLPAAFDALAYLYERDAEFAAGCHGNAHEIGEAAYRLWRGGKAFELTPKASYCGFGFYHGFMDILVAEEGDVGRGKAFCWYAGEILREQTIDAEGACYHGIGHGAVDGTLPATWGSPQATIAPGLSLCEKLAGKNALEVEEYGPLYRCTTGAYNALEILSQNEKYRLEGLVRDPFGFCRTQKSSYRTGCYTNMLPAMLRLHEGDLAVIIAAIDALPDEWGGYRMRRAIARDLFHEHGRLSTNERDGGLVSGRALCASVPEAYRTACVEGVAGGLVKYGPPKREHERALAFCAGEGFSQNERDACYGWVLPRLRNTNSLAQARAICSTVPENARERYCKAYE